MGANDTQALKAILEAESYEGPSLVIAYSHCIAHGIDMAKGLQSQKALVDSGEWILYRYDPRRVDEGHNPLQLDSRPAKQSVRTFLDMENRFKMLHRTSPTVANELAKLVQSDVERRRKHYEYLAAQPYSAAPTEAEE